MLINNFTATNSTYKRSIWPVLKTINNPNAPTDDNFGESVAIDDSGTVIVVGAKSYSTTGRTYVFYKDEGGTDNWGLKKTIEFGGDAVAINEEGTMIASTDSSSRTLKIYYKDEGGVDNWGEKKSDTVTDASGTSTGFIYSGSFGNAIDIRNNKLIVADYKADYRVYIGGSFPIVFLYYDIGGAIIYYKDEGGTDNWGAKKTIYGELGNISDFSGKLGRSLKFNSTSDILMICNEGNGEINKYTRIYYKDEGGTDNWGLKKSLSGNIYTNEPSEYLSVMNDNGTTVVFIDANYNITIHKKDLGGTDNWGFSQTINTGLDNGDTNAGVYGNITFHPTNNDYFILGINRPDSSIGAITYQQSGDGNFGVAQVLKDEDYTTTNLNLTGLYQWRSSLLNGGYYLNAAEYPIEAAIAYDHDLVQYTDETTAATNDTDNDVTLLPTTPAVDDAYYFGSSKTFTSITIDFGASGGGGVWTLAWEYWNGSAWTALAGVIDDTDGFTATGIKSTNFTLPGDWATTTVNSQGPFYYIRAKVSTYTSVVQNPVVKKLTIGGGNPNVTLPDAVIENKEVMTEIFGTPITQISNGEWWYGDADTLGYDTIYISLSDNTNPNTKPYNYIQSGIEATSQFKDIGSSLSNSQIALANNLLIVGGGDGNKVNIHELGDVII